MSKAGLQFSQLEKENREINHWVDSTGHYPVTALAFQAEYALIKGKLTEAKTLLDSAKSYIRPDLPSRAYEHLYEVRSEARGSEGDWNGAIEDIDTLLTAHKDFPSFYLNDLLLKAELLYKAGHYKESATTYSELTQFHDSVWKDLVDRRLDDLTSLYHTRLEHEHKKTEQIKFFSWCALTFVLLSLLGASLIYSYKEKKRGRILVERLKELDALAEPALLSGSKDKQEELTLIERLDRHLRIERPFTNPALGRKELAEFIGISQEALGQLIKEEKGTSIRNYINSFRLEEARHVLGSESVETIADLAVRLGFGTARTLQRAFKERYDMSPTTYRNTAREL